MQRNIARRAASIMKNLVAEIFVVGTISSVIFESVSSAPKLLMTASYYVKQGARKLQLQQYECPMF